jgi:hypothetical protein
VELSPNSGGPTVESDEQRGLRLGGSWKVLFQSLYLRPRSTVSRHPKVGKGWRREKRQPLAKETRDDFYVGVV